MPCPSALSRALAPGRRRCQPILVNLLALVPGERTAVAFRFTPRGLGSWLIDDVYVDPYGTG